MKALTMEEMRALNGGDTCGDIEGAMMICALLGAELAVAFLVGAWLGNRCYE